MITLTEILSSRSPHKRVGRQEKPLPSFVHVEKSEWLLHLPEVSEASISLKEIK